MSAPSEDKAELARAKNQKSRKRKPEEDPDEEEHEAKPRKELESWDDLEGLMKCRMVRGKCRKAYEGLSYLFTDVWQEIWEDGLEKEHRRNFYSD